MSENFNQPEDWEDLTEDERKERLLQAGSDLIELLERTADPDGDKNSVWTRLKKQ